LIYFTDAVLGTGISIIGYITFVQGANFRHHFRVISDVISGFSLPYGSRIIGNVKYIIKPKSTYQHSNR
jgi:hypothetical protein